MLLYMYLKLSLSAKCTLKGLSQFVNVCDVHQSVSPQEEIAQLSRGQKSGAGGGVYCV